MRLYEDMGAFSDIKPLFENIMARYNETKKPMNLVFFDDALEHLTRISRTLRLPQVGWHGTPAAALPRLPFVQRCHKFQGLGGASKVAS